MLQLSPSAINTFFECPKKYWFEKVAKRPHPKFSSMIPGSAFHATVEKALKERQQGTEWQEDDFKSVAVAEFDREVKEAEDAAGIRWFKDRDEELDKTVRLADFFGKNIYDEYRNPQAIEHWVEEQRGPDSKSTTYSIRGVIDLIDELGSGVDWKTSSKKWSDNAARYSIQRLVYLKFLPNKLKFTFEVLCTADGKIVRQKIVVDTQPKDLEMADSVIDGVAKSIQSGAFPRNIGTHCNFCPFVDECHNRKALVWVE